MTPMGLNDILPAKARRALYAVYAFLGLALGATQVAFSAADSGQPTWLTVALAVFAFVGTALGFTAAANTPPSPRVAGPFGDDSGDDHGFPREL